MPAKRYQFFTPSTNRLLIVVGFLGLIALVVWWTSGVPRPREADRVSTLVPSFSVIHPPDWEADQRVGNDQSAYICGIQIAPKKSVGRDIRFFTGELKKPYDVEKFKAMGYKTVTFEGEPAWANGVMNKHDFSFTLDFTRGGRWFEQSIRLPFPDDVPKSEWWPYFESFRLTPRPTTSSTNPS